MNRIVVFGAVAFLALVGIAMMGGTGNAIAAVDHHEEEACTGDDCCGGLFARLRAKMATRCCGEAEEVVEEEVVEEVEECSGRRSLFSCHGRDRCSGRERCTGRERRMAGLMSSLRNRCSGEETCSGEGE